jgi:hypothetical protein
MGIYDGLVVPDILKGIDDETMKTSLGGVSQFLNELVLKGKKSEMVNADGNQQIRDVKTFTGNNIHTGSEIFTGKTELGATYGDWITDTDGATVTFNMSASNRHLVVLGGNRTLAVSNVSIGQVFIIKLKQDGTGTRTVTWFSGISWPAAVVPTLTTTLNKADFFIFICTALNAYDGFTVGMNL